MTAMATGLHVLARVPNFAATVRTDDWTRLEAAAVGGTFTPELRKQIINAMTELSGRRAAADVTRPALAEIDAILADVSHHATEMLAALDRLGDPYRAPDRADHAAAFKLKSELAAASTGMGLASDVTALDMRLRLMIFKAAAQRARRSTRVGRGRPAEPEKKAFAAAMTAVFEAAEARGAG